MKYLDPTRERFNVTWVLTSDVTNEGPHTVLSQLRLLDAHVVVTPFHDSPIMIEWLSEDPLDGTPPASAVWVRSGSLAVELLLNVFKTYIYFSLCRKTI